jgi:HKD family nuclease
MKKTQVKLILNDAANSNHGVHMSKLLQHAKRLDCMVAFAKLSGLKAIKGQIVVALENGLDARIAIGLSFYQTEPKLLKALLQISETYGNLRLYVSNTQFTFHPKIYVFSNDQGSDVLIGSANFTQGGFSSNFEASVLVSDPQGELSLSILRHMQRLIDETVLVEATLDVIDDYEKNYWIYKSIQSIGQQRAQKAVDTQGKTSLALAEILLEMKRDTTDEGFQRQCSLRRERREQSMAMLKKLAKIAALTESNFLSNYEQLIDQFRSGGLARGKTKIARNAKLFQMSIKKLLKVIREELLTPEKAYDFLHQYFNKIPGAGVNVLTEVLHSIDNKKFAVMNQNAVDGLRLSKDFSFPIHPLKTNVNGLCYQDFCNRAAAIRDELGLADFSELDAVFNYAYWKPSNFVSAEDSAP